MQTKMHKDIYTFVDTSFGLLTFIKKVINKKKRKKEKQVIYTH